MTKQSELISNNNVDLAELSYVGLLKEGSKAGSSDHAPKILGISGGAVSAVTGTLAVIGEEFGEELWQEFFWAPMRSGRHDLTARDRLASTKVISS